MRGCVEVGLHCNVTPGVCRHAGASYNSLMLMVEGSREAPASSRRRR